MDFFIILAVILIVTNLAVFFGRKIKIPSVVILIFAGIILGLPFFEKNFLGQNQQLIFNIGDVGLLALMFLAGLKSSWRLLYKEKKDATLIALFSALVPLGLAYFVFSLLGFSWQVALIVGICMSISAEATRAKVLLELKKLKTKLGAALIGAGLVDDALGLSIFILITYFIKEAGTKEEMLVAGSIISFFVGVVVQRIVGKRNIMVKYIERLFNWLVIPFFFVSIGIHFDFYSLALNPLILFWVLIIAIFGKFIGSFLAKPFVDFNWKQLYLIGWSMNSRGALEMAIALIAFRVQLIHLKLYSSLIVMAFVTTLMFPFIIIPMIKKDPQVMDR
ncbi:MAG: cation:proton antiporter [Candidatus Omnitrophica bacterium]|nr:cation:proton antiporter [Candidatus Omnitrophota bacterium]